MGFELCLTKAAEADYETIAHYTALHWGQAQAGRYLDQIEAGFAAIQENPALGRSKHGVPATIQGHTIGRHIIF